MLTLFRFCSRFSKQWMAVALIIASPFAALADIPTAWGATAATVLGETITFGGLSGAQGAFNTTNFWSDPYGATVNGAADLQFVLTPFGTTRTITVTFTEPVTDPVLHVDRLGGGVTDVFGVTRTNSTSWALTSFTATSATVTPALITGNPQFRLTTTAGVTSFFRAPNVLAPTPPSAECTATDPGTGVAGTGGTACGSVRFTGTNITSLTFTVTWVGVDNTTTGDGIEMSWSIPPTSLVVKKQSNGATGVFPFTATTVAAGGSFNLDTGAANPATSATLKVSDYTRPIVMTEAAAAGITVDSVTCVDQNGATITSGLAGSTGTITAANYVARLQTITCTFVNTISTAASVFAFRSVVLDGAPVVEWQTGFERGTLGFDLLRLDPKAKSYTRINQRPIRGAIESGAGGTYRVRDEAAVVDETATYALREMQTSGVARTYGPFVVMPVAAEHGDPVRSMSKDDTTAREMRPTRGRRLTRAAPILEEKDPRPERMLDALPTSPGSTKELAAPVTLTSRARLASSSDNVYHITAAQLAAAMGDTAAHLQSQLQAGAIRLREQGQVVSWAKDAAGTGLYFFGRGITSPDTSLNIYQLDLVAGTAMGTASTVSTPPTTVAQTFLSKTHVEENHFAAPFAGGDPRADFWYWGLAANGDPAPSFTVATPGAAMTGTAHIDVTLRGGSNDPGSRNHHAVVRVNGVQVGSVIWQGLAAATLAADFNASILVDGNNAVEVEAVLDAGNTSSFFLVNGFDVTYPRFYRALGDRLRFRGGANPTVTVNGFTTNDIAVFDVTNPRLPLAVTGVNVTQSGATYRASFTPSAPTRDYFAVTLRTTPSVASIEGDQPSSLKTTANAAQYLVISPASLRAGADALASYRSARYSTKVVDIQDVYDEFSFGVVDPTAIKSFLTYAGTSWTTKPSYVTLVGKGTIDPKNYSGFGTNVFPVLMTSSPDGLYASDNKYADFASDDGVPDVAMGRIPALTVNDVTAYVAKLTTFEATTGTPAKRAVLLADNADAGGNFPLESEDVSTHIPATVTKDRVYHAGDVAATRSRLFTSLNAGAALFNYVGHASFDYLAEEQLLRAADAPTLTNASGTPIFLGLTCIVGDGTLPGFDSLAETLLWRQGGGIAASFAPTGLSGDRQAHRLNNSIVDGLYAAGRSGILGDATKTALANLKATGGTRQMLDIYQILGDPALKIPR